MKLELIRIGLYPVGQQGDDRHASLKDSQNYYAIAVELFGKYYYWAKGVSLKVSREELERVRANPVLHYFSTGLKLHFRIDRELERRSWLR